MNNLICPNCGSPCSLEDVACPHCGQLLYVPELNALAAQAMAMELSNQSAAARLWQRALTLVPPNSPQAGMLRQRIQSLRPARSASGNWFAPSPSTATAIQRTLASLLLSLVCYSGLFWYWGGFTATDALLFGFGFVCLILVHEMGHVLAIRHYGMRASPPIFIPFVGAVINIPPPRDALEESVVGIGGPVLGTVGALLCFQLFRTFHSPLLLQLSFYGFAINLFNMLPVPPLDGGRITAAVTPWFWIPGLAAIVLLLVNHLINVIGLVILVFALPRIWQTLRHRSRAGDYYNVGAKATAVMGISYVLLCLILGGMMYYSYTLLPPGF